MDIVSVKSLPFHASDVNLLPRSLARHLRSACKVCPSTKVAALPGECERVDPLCGCRVILGMHSARRARLERGAFPNVSDPQAGWATHLILTKPHFVGAREAIEAGSAIVTFAQFFKLQGW